MKKFFSFLLILALLAGLFTGCNTKTSSPTPGNAQNQATSELAGTYSVTIWVSELAGVAELTAKQIKAFQEANPGIIIKASIEGVTESEVGYKVAADVASAPDIFCFAQDQLARLVQAAALNAPGTQASNHIREQNDAASVQAASLSGTLYAYPMTSDNGYYMYYDKSVISDPEHLEAIIADCEKAGKKIRFGLEDAWYTASFFFATGCRSDWTMDANGNFTALEDTFNSPAGLTAMKGMQKLTHSPAYDANAEVFTDAAVVVTGIWNANAAQAHFGKNLAATDLPSFTVDGQSYQLGSFFGSKLMGVKPQSDAKKAAVLSRLAQYLTAEECQLQRYEAFQWGPSNRNAQDAPTVRENLSLTALRQQSRHAVLQNHIHGGWWDVARVLGAQAKNAKTDKDLQAALDNYSQTVQSLLS